MPLRAITGHQCTNVHFPYTDCISVQCMLSVSTSLVVYANSWCAPIDSTSHASLDTHQVYTQRPQSPEKSESRVGRGHHHTEPRIAVEAGGIVHPAAGAAAFSALVDERPAARPLVIPAEAGIQKDTSARANGLVFSPSPIATRV